MNTSLSLPSWGFEHQPPMWSRETLQIPLSLYPTSERATKILCKCNSVGCNPCFQTVVSAELWCSVSCKVSLSHRCLDHYGFCYGGHLDCAQFWSALIFFSVIWYLHIWIFDRSSREVWLTGMGRQTLALPNTAQWLFMFFLLKVLELSPSVHTNTGYTMLAKLTIDRNNRS